MPQNDSALSATQENCYKSSKMKILNIKLFINWLSLIVADRQFWLIESVPPSMMHSLKCGKTALINLLVFFALLIFFDLFLYLCTL